jgi:hypothetical protein
VLGVVAIAFLLVWFDKYVERRELAKFGRDLSATLRAPHSEIVTELDRVLDLARKVAEVDVRDSEFDKLAPGQQRAIVARQEVLVLRSLADDMTRYVREAN